MGLIDVRNTLYSHKLVGESRSFPVSMEFQHYDAMVACLLVVFGSDINRVMRRNLSGQHFIVRTLAFVAVNAFGFGAFIVWASPFLARQLRALPAEWYFTVIVTVFVFVGIWAQRNKQI